ncbi:MAG: monovalent cation/H+ antiporter complex subunit F [Acidimicrobiales bacterium]
MIAAAFVAVGLAALGFGYRLLRGPSLADRMMALDGLLIVGVSAIALRAMQTGIGAFTPVAVVVTLVGFIGTAVVARFIEGEGR